MFTFTTGLLVVCGLRFIAILFDKLKPMGSLADVLILFYLVVGGLFCVTLKIPFK